MSPRQPANCSDRQRELRVHPQYGQRPSPAQDLPVRRRALPSDLAQPRRASRGAAHRHRGPAESSAGCGPDDSGSNKPIAGQKLEALRAYCAPTRAKWWISAGGLRRKPSSASRTQATPASRRSTWEPATDVEALHPRKIEDSPLPEKQMPRPRYHARVASESRERDETHSSAL